MPADRLRALAIQAAVLLCVGAAIFYFTTNAAANLAALGLASGFGFLDQVAGFDISFTLLPYDRGSSTYWKVLAVGITNTLAISILGIFLASILGFIIGILQLSGNWPLVKVCRSYIETARNIPLLLQLLFWYTVTLATLPHQRDSIELGEAVFLNVRGLYVPRPLAEAGLPALLIALALAVAASVALWLHPRRRAAGVGALLALPVTLVLMLLAVGAAALLFGRPLGWDYPVLTGFNFVGGLWLPPEFVALLLGLTLYTSAFIAEIVRGGVQAVPRGQVEAALALGLGNWQVMRQVVVPQALRIIVPPLTSQYLNLIKNSSLAVAIAYPDIVSVFTGTALNQTGRAIEIVAITMGFYLTVSLTVSALMNWYNRRVALVGR